MGKEGILAEAGRGGKPGEEVNEKRLPFPPSGKQHGGPLLR